MVNAVKKRVLVTGGAGFIGSNFIRYLYQAYPAYEIYNLDLLTYAGNRENLKDIETLESTKRNRRYFFVKGDIRDPRLVSKLFQKYQFDYVVNFAAESHVDRSIEDDYHFIHTNLLGVHNIITLIRKYSIPRFIHISTDEIYGDTLEGFSHEQSPIQPSNPYSASKAAADLLIQAYIRTHRLPILVVRGSNNFGPYQYPEKLIPLVITNLLERKAIPVHGDGKQIRTWIHVNDFCNAVDRVMHRGKELKTYNASGIEMSNLEVIKLIGSILNIDYNKYIRFVKDRPGGDRRYAPDATKIKTELGWRLEFPIHKHLGGVVQWYVDNLDWWKKVKRKKDFKTYYKKQVRAEF